jgi:hypothetical protein
MAPGLSLVRALEMPLAWWAENLSSLVLMRSIAFYNAERTRLAFWYMLPWYSTIILLNELGY